MTARPDFLRVLAETAARRGDHRAVEAPDGNYTYQQIERLSNRLANRLLALGVGRETLVGVSSRRGAGELVALLAISKAGGAYVPLDPSHPIDRLQLVVESAAPRVMLLHSDSPLRAGAGRETIALDDLEAAVAGYPDTPPPVVHDPMQLAYVLFTSGSTGRPKGVEITRGAFTNFLASMAHKPGMSESDRLLAITTTSFDIAGLELLLPLWVGATVVIADKATTQDSRRLRRLLEDGAITIMQATPAAWRLLFEAGWAGDRRLRILCGGEALPPTLADRLLAAGGELWNMYGPTETTVWSTLDRIRPGYDRITIGRPIDETQVIVLDDSLRPVPVGQEGELCIGGSGLARGYLGRADLTTERFVHVPGAGGGERLYRTGDLGRALPDGRFECLGRLDHQVKLHGFRVELGEIETVLASVPGVSDVLVVANRPEGGTPILSAYWVGEAGRDALIDEARRRLPAYMVPSTYTRMLAFPLNTNGKIDRKRLPAATGDAAESAPRRRARNDGEARIAAIWSDVLGLVDVPVDESFFNLGGSSVLAMQVLIRIERDMGVSLPVQALFEAPTVEELAARLGASFSPDDPIVVWLRRGRSEVPPLFCLFGVALYQSLAIALPGERSVIGMHIPFRYVPGRDRRPSLDEIAVRYAESVRRQQPRGPYHLLGFCFGGVVAYEVARLLEAEGEAVQMVVVLDAELPQGVRVHWGKRLCDYARRACRPSGIGALVRGLARRIAARRRAPGGAETSADPTSAVPIDLPVLGPEADAAVARFSTLQRRLAGRLLIVRATEEPAPRWLSKSADYGWGGRAGEVVALDIPATHLDLLREPHARTLAAKVVSVWDQPTAGNRSSVRSTSSGSIVNSSPTDAPTTNPNH